MSYRIEGAGSRAQQDSVANKPLANINSLMISSVEGANGIVLNKILRDTAQQELSMAIKLPKSDANCSAAASLGADACLKVEVAEYVERTGSNLSASNAASVDFTVHVLGLNGGRDIWSSRFTFKDTPLSENIIQFGANVTEKGGSAGFTTARKLFEKGVRDALRKLNDDRTKQFLK